MRQGKKIMFRLSTCLDVFKQIEWVHEQSALPSREMNFLFLLLRFHSTSYNAFSKIKKKCQTKNGRSTKKKREENAMFCKLTISRYRWLHFCSGWFDFSIHILCFRFSYGAKFINFAIEFRIIFKGNKENIIHWKEMIRFYKRACELRTTRRILLSSTWKHFRLKIKQFACAIFRMNQLKIHHRRRHRSTIVFHDEYFTFNWSSFVYAVAVVAVYVSFALASMHTSPSTCTLHWHHYRMRNLRMCILNRCAYRFHINGK